MSLDPRGVWTAITTPFLETDELDLPALEALCERQAAAGVGIVACGTTGETPTLTQEEIDKIVSTALRVAHGRVQVIVGTGTNSTRTTLDRTRRARELGADGVLVVTPYYNNPPVLGQIAHFEAVAHEGGLPVVLYNVPSRTGTQLGVETIAHLAEHPQIVAVKEASGDLELFKGILAATPEDFVVLSGDDALTAPAMNEGAHGAISVASNVVPRAVARLVAAGAAGDQDSLTALHEGLTPLFNALFLTANPIPVKAAQAMLGQGSRTLRLPLLAEALSGEMARTLRLALDRALLLEGGSS